MPTRGCRYRYELQGGDRYQLIWNVNAAFGDAAVDADPDCVTHQECLFAFLNWTCLLWFSPGFETEHQAQALLSIPGAALLLPAPGALRA